MDRRSRFTKRCDILQLGDGDVVRVHNRGLAHVCLALERLSLGHGPFPGRSRTKHGLASLNGHGTTSQDSRVIWCIFSTFNASTSKLYPRQPHYRYKLRRLNWLANFGPHFTAIRLYRFPMPLTELPRLFPILKITVPHAVSRFLDLLNVPRQ